MMNPLYFFIGLAAASIVTTKTMYDYYKDFKSRQEQLEDFEFKRWRI